MRRLEREGRGLEVERRIVHRALAPIERYLAPSVAAAIRERLENALALHPVLSAAFREVLRAEAPRELETAPWREAARVARPRPANDVAPTSEEEKAQAERDARVLSVRPLCKWFATRYAQRGAGAREDLEQEALATVVALADRYDASRASFKTFVYEPIENLMIGKLRREITKRRTIRPPPLTQLMREEDESPEEAMTRLASAFVMSEVLALDDDPFASGETRVLRAERRAALAKAMGTLEDRDRRLLEGYYGGRELRETAAELGVAYRTAKRRHQEALVALHARLANG